MSESDTWMPIYIGDYMADTMHLSTEEHGAYFLLIMHYWRNGKIKNDQKTIKNITKISAKKCDRIIAFFVDENGWLVHKRIESEIIKAKKNQEARSAKAKAGADARWGNKECLKDAPSIAPDMHKQCPSPSPKSIITTTSTVSARLSVDNFPSDNKIPIPESDEDLNFFVCVEVISDRLDRKLNAKEQEAVALWFELYDMRQALELVESELEKYRKRNKGQSPPATYFTPVLKQAFGGNYPRKSSRAMVSGLAKKMKT